MSEVQGIADLLGENNRQRFLLRREAGVRSRARDPRRDSSSPEGGSFLSFLPTDGRLLTGPWREPARAVVTRQLDSEVAGSALIGLCVEIAIDVLLIGIPLVCLGFAIAGSST